MRYYSFILAVNEEYIIKNTTIRLKDYYYDNAIGAMNTYVVRNIENDLAFFAYREENNRIYSSMSYDEQKTDFQAAYDHITGMLESVFKIRKFAGTPEEITMFEYMDNLNEATRRDYIQMRHRIVEAANLWMWGYYKTDQRDNIRYDFKEYMIPKKPQAKQAIYDEGFIAELDKIKSHKNTEEFKGNMVHYVISAGSIEAARDMTGCLMQSLSEAGRISSGRMEIISDILPEAYKGSNYLEDIIENNFGGVVVFDLTESFGHDPVEYVRMSDYIEKLLKQYRNRCLFVFNYNVDHPGFSYMILPKLSKYVLPVALKEGRGDRKASVKYLASLIKNSEYSEYSGQAAEFLKLFPGDDFSQTDILSAFEKFGPWCINKNVIKAYDFDLSGDFMLDRSEHGESPSEKLKSLIGLNIVKQEIEKIISADLVEKERRKQKGNNYNAGSMHMVFAGNPGSAKTTVAKLFAGIAKEKGILKSGAFVERGGMDLCGLDCVTAIRDAFIAAKGGVLFIDEAYSMKYDTPVTVLIQEMENRRDDVIVILAGYSERMKAFMEINEGLKSRVPNWIDFPDYSADELTDIFRLMIKERGFSATEDAVNEAHYIFEKVRFLEDFGNGRYVRNLVDRAVRDQSNRLLADGKGVENVRKEELFLFTKKDIHALDDGLREEREPGTALKELDEMIGLSSVKDVIHKAIANFKFNKLCMERGIARDRASLHMVFMGNPGSAKTTVARLFAEIMRDEKVLPSGNFVEAGRADLVGPAVGSTPYIVKKKFSEARGGVLFIDEAYSLCDGAHGANGDEAINTIVQEMENHREDVIVIFAGYPKPMQEFLDRNPGMRSRIAFNVNFEDYSADELCGITKLMLSKKQMSITDSAMDKLKSMYDRVCGSRDFGNGRFVRKVLEEAQMNLAERVMKLDIAEITTELITTVDECDIPATDFFGAVTVRKVGFF